MLHCWYYFRKIVYSRYQFNTRKVLPATFTQGKTGGRVFYSGVNLAGSTLLVVYIFRDNVVCALEVNYKVTLHRKSTMRE